MGRKAIQNPVKKYVIQIDEESFNYINQRKRQGEPIYKVVWRILSEYRLKDSTPISEQNDQLKKTLEAVYARARKAEGQLAQFKDLNDQTVLY